MTKKKSNSLNRSMLALTSKESEAKEPLTSSSSSTALEDAIDGGRDYLTMNREALRKLFAENSELINIALNMAKDCPEKSTNIISAVLTHSDILPDERSYARTIEILYKIKKKELVKFEDIKGISKIDSTPIVYLKSLEMVLDQIKERIQNKKKGLLSSERIRTLNNDVEYERNRVIKQLTDSKIETKEEYYEYKNEIKKLDVRYFNGKEYSQFNNKFIDLAIEFKDYIAAAEHIIVICKKNCDYSSVIKLLEILTEITTKDSEVRQSTASAQDDLFNAAKIILEKIINDNMAEKQQAEIDYYKLQVNYAETPLKQDTIISELRDKASNNLETFNKIDDINPLIDMTKNHSNQYIRDKALSQVVKLIYEQDLQNAIEGKNPIKGQYENYILLKVGIYAYHKNDIDSARSLFKTIADSNTSKDLEQDDIIALWQAKTIIHSKTVDNIHQEEKTDHIKSAIKKYKDIYKESEELVILLSLIEGYCDQQMLSELKNTLVKCYDVVDKSTNVGWDNEKLTSKLLSFAKGVRESGEINNAKIIYDNIYDKVSYSMKLRIKEELGGIIEVEKARKFLAESANIINLEEEFNKVVSDYAKAYQADYEQFRKNYLAYPNISQDEYNNKVTYDKNKYKSELAGIKSRYDEKIMLIKKHEKIITDFCPLSHPEHLNDDVEAIGLVDY